VAEVAGAAQGSAHVDAPLGVVPGGEGEQHGAGVTRSAGGDDRGGRSGRRGRGGPVGDAVSSMAAEGGVGLGVAAARPRAAAARVGPRLV
jgi:hypothetical protein